MNSDPHESAAWRAFGLLDADETSAFDEAMRRDPELKQAYLDMEHLAATIAVTSVKPVAPRAGQLQRLERQLGLHPVKRPNWAAMSGWAAAAVVTILLLVKRDPPVENSIAIIPPLPAPITRPTTIAVQPSEENSGELDPSLEKETDLPEIALTEHTELTGEDGNKVFTRQETRQLIQEIEVLKERLQDLQQHGQERFEVVPGTARPIVMRMSPPGIPAEVPADISLDYEEPPMTAILGDALASANDHSKDGVGKSGPTSTKLNPSAVPIYDPELNTGTLVVLNLPTTGPEESYNLWVKTAAEEAPVYVGRLPKSENRAADSFDFSLGSGGVVPTGFMLTRDSQGKPTEPAASNTVLQGP